MATERGIFGRGDCVAPKDDELDQLSEVVGSVPALQGMPLICSEDPEQGEPGLSGLLKVLLKVLCTAPRIAGIAEAGLIVGY